MEGIYRVLFFLSSPREASRANLGPMAVAAVGYELGDAAGHIALNAVQDNLPRRNTIKMQ